MLGGLLLCAGRRCLLKDDRGVVRTRARPLFDWIWGEMVDFGGQYLWSV